MNRICVEKCSKDKVKSILHYNRISRGQLHLLSGYILYVYPSGSTDQGCEWVTPHYHPALAGTRTQRWICKGSAPSGRSVLWSPTGRSRAGTRRRGQSPGPRPRQTWQPGGEQGPCFKQHRGRRHRVLLGFGSDSGSRLALVLSAQSTCFAKVCCRNKGASRLVSCQMKPLQYFPFFLK